VELRLTQNQAEAQKANEWLRDVFEKIIWEGFGMFFADYELGIEELGEPPCSVSCRSGVNGFCHLCRTASSAVSLVWSLVLNGIRVCGYIVISGRGFRM
jgi:hypothetical protein